MGDIQHSFAVKVGDEVRISDDRVVPVAGYSKFDVEVPASSSGSPGTAALQDAVPLGTSNDTSAIACVVIDADEYEKLEYSVDGGSGFLALDQPIVLTARGAIDSFGFEDEALHFKNKGDNVRKIQVVIGRT